MPNWWTRRLTEGSTTPPDFAIIVYPGYLALAEQNFANNPDITVTEKTPPSFIVMAEDDPVHVENATAYFLMLKNAKVPAELHISSSGGLKHLGRYRCKGRG